MSRYTTTVADAADAVAPQRKNVVRHRLFLMVLGFALLAGLSFLILPLALLLTWQSPGDFLQALQSETTRNALSLSLSTSLLATLIVIALGTPLAFVLARYQFAGSTVVDTLIDLPMVLPPMVGGLALLMLFGRNGPVGGLLAHWNIFITFTTVAVVMAQVFVALPFYVRAARAGFEGVDRRLEAASLLLGESRLRTFFRITVPLTWPSMLAGIVLAWARCLGEFGATVVFAGNLSGITQTMPLAIYSSMQDNIGAALALATILLIVSFTLVLLLKYVIAAKGKAYA